MSLDLEFGVRILRSTSETTTRSSDRQKSEKYYGNIKEIHPYYLSSLYKVVRAVSASVLYPGGKLRKDSAGRGRGLIKVRHPCIRPRSNARPDEQYNSCFRLSVFDNPILQSTLYLLSSGHIDPDRPDKVVPTDRRTDGRTDG
jgi:hypothetical protein